MKKFVFAALASAAFALPGFAEIVVLEFAPDGADKVTIEAGPHVEDMTWDESTLTLCSETPNGTVCATFAEMMTAAGDTTTFTADNGHSGTVTLVELK